jgi:hypothetical protein
LAVTIKKKHLNVNSESEFIILCPINESEIVNCPGEWRRLLMELKKILVPADGSEVSMRAVGYAVKRADKNTEF